jgi:hypothetical protein
LSFPPLLGRERDVQNALRYLLMEVADNLALPRIPKRKKTDKIEQVRPVILVCERTCLDNAPERRRELALEARHCFLEGVRLDPLNLQAIEVALERDVVEAAVECLMVLSSNTTTFGPDFFRGTENAFK